MGLLAGMAVGLVLVVLLGIRVFDLLDGLGSGCPCEPIVEQVRWPHDRGPVDQSSIAW
ncbi:hypothetical protein Asera_34710 [Actinocatenispora sera]|uniref:Uncharacterized protein n=1 Tax=Actinocatenispora sera TaxID=390989 RepID=A0A810L1T0_9ACTN|nr:hypothetical protein Asera_34710 [Actinocatenispora sera]